MADERPDDHEASQDGGLEAADLIPDRVEDVAERIADTSRSATARAGSTARAAGEASTLARHEAGARITEIETAARRDDPRHWRALAACILAAVATAIDPPILQATSSGAQGALRLDPEGTGQLISLVYIIQAGAMVLGGVLGDLRGLKRVLLVGPCRRASVLDRDGGVGSATELGLSHLGLSLFSAIVVPLSLASVMRTFAPNVLPVAIALYLSIQLVAALSSPPLAQQLYERGGFAATMVPSMFFTVLALIASWRWLPTIEAGERMRLADALTMTLWSIGILAIVYGVTAAVAGWGTLHLTAVAAGAAVLLAALSRMRVGRTRLRLPQLPFRVLGVTLVAGAAIGTIQSGVLLNCPRS